MTTENWREELRKSLYERHFSTTQAEESYLEVEAMIDSLLSKERNEVLDEVKKEVEDIFIDSKNIDYDNGYTTACKDISTLLENLKVK